MSPDDHITSNAEVAINYSTMFDRPTSPSPQSLNRLAVPPSLTLREASLSPPPDQVANTPQHELISFESFSTPTASPGPQDNAAAGPSSQPQMATTINYLSPSPRRAISPIRIQCDIIDTRPESPSPMRRSPRLSPRLSPVEKLSTVDDQIDDQVPSPYERPTRPEPRTPISLSPSPALKDQLEAPQPRTPRRSPRRSVTPQAFKPESVGSPPPVPPLPAGTATSSSFQTQFETPLAIGAARSLVEPPSGAQTRKKRWKGKEKATSPGAEVMNDSQEERSGSGSVDSGEDQSEGKGERKGKRRQEQAREKVERMHRELGSLSPGSANVLAQLYPSIQTTMTPDGSPVKEQEPKKTDTTEVAPQESKASIFPPHLSALLASVQRPPPGSPVRFASPSVGRPSPTKLIPNLDLEDPTRTPARRIPIRQAIAQGSASAQMLAHTKSYPRPNDNGGLDASLRTPLFSRALDDPLRSPAKRIPISEVFSSAKNIVSSTTNGLQTPVRGISRERSGSAEPRPRNGRERSGSAEPQPRHPMDLPRSSTLFRPASKLPFPLVPAQSPEHDRPTSIPEENEDMFSPGAPTPPECDTTVLPPTSSPTKSGLKQLSNSRIPRIGSKPYTRPTTSVKDQESKLPIGSRRAISDSKVVTGMVRLFSSALKIRLIFSPGQTKLSNSVRLVKSGSASGSSSDDTNIAPGSSTRAKGLKDTPASTNLKRKRGEKTSPSQARPVVLIRQVVPGMLGPKYAPSTPPAAPSSTKDLGSTQVEVSPVKKAQRPITMRRVVNRLPEKTAARDRVEQEADTPDIVDEEMADTARKHDKDEHATIMVAKKSSQVTKKEATLLLSPILPGEDPVPSQDTADSTVPEHHTSGSSPLEDDTEFSTKVRRTTRARKQIPLNDVFTAPRPLQPRRKTPSSNRPDSDGFSGLSSVALKALTSSNTARNQLNFVSLATEVIRKDGCRPESPIMKVRTISQREAEEKSKGRSERAHRRARRSDDGLSDTDGFSSDRGDSSIMEGEEEGQWGEDDEDEEGRPYKHRRGPGDDEDYETPAKLERTLKRPRLGEEKEESQVEIQEKKRVKWDRGLYSEIYLDEIEIKPKKRPKEDIVKKGCLAPTAKVCL